MRIFSHDDRYWDNLQKRSSYDSIHVGCYFSNRNTLVAILRVFPGSLPRFSWILRRFSQILPRFSEILPGFSPNRKTFGSAFALPAPPALTPLNKFIGEFPGEVLKNKNQETWRKLEYFGTKWNLQASQNHVTKMQQPYACMKSQQILLINGIVFDDSLTTSKTIGFWNVQIWFALNHWLFDVTSYNSYFLPIKFLVWHNRKMTVR